MQKAGLSSLTGNLGYVLGTQTRCTWPAEPRFGCSQGIDLEAGGRNKKTWRTAPKSENVYLKLLVKVRRAAVLILLELHFFP